MLPALCFVLSRKQIEICAREITTVLLEDDSKTPYIIRRECEQIIRKLPNYEEYLELPEYNEMVALLEKGIAVHHSGVTAVFRELIEILYSKGYIKLLFGTETFSIGLNMPTKTVIFTDVNKFDGDSMRLLYSHEYTQMAGRAGRRHIDTVGHVIHLNNLFRNIDCTSYKNMMNGRPQTLVSKFKISFNLILNLIDIGNNNFNGFTEKSMIQNDINSELENITNSLNKTQKEIENMDIVLNHLQTPKNITEEYIDLIEKRKFVVNKKKKEVERKIQEIEETNRFIKSDIKIVQEYNSKLIEHEKIKEDYELTKKYLNKNVNSILDFLYEDNIIVKKEENDSIVYELTQKGFIANHLKEVHCLVFACLIEKNILDECSSTQLVGILSCFTNVNVSDDCKTINPYSRDNKVELIVKNIAEHYEKYLKMEEKYQLNTGTDYEIHYDLIDYAIEWCKCSDVSDCKILLQKLEIEKGVFLGEFVKALLKINNIVCEMEKIAENTNNLPFLSKLNEIKTLTLKYVVTNQSLYV
jgi:superfamily II RNA helicase